MAYNFPKMQEDAFTREMCSHGKKMHLITEDKMEHGVNARALKVAVVL